MVMEFIEGLGAWAWWVLGAVLLAIEVFAPGNVFVWFGVAAILTGTLALFTELSWQTELIVFIALSVVLVVAGRRFFASRMESSDQPLLNERAVRYVGKTFVLAEPIIDGTGRIRIDDTQWRIEGADMPSGTRVKVAGVDGTVLSVVKLDG